MQIVDNRKKDATKFKDVGFGTIFEIDNQGIFMKCFGVNNANAVNLRSGETWFVSPTLEITPRPDFYLTNDPK